MPVFLWLTQSFIIVYLFIKSRDLLINSNTIGEVRKSILFCNQAYLSIYLLAMLIEAIKKEIVF